jgi:hypothetical protein
MRRLLAWKAISARAEVESCLRCSRSVGLTNPFQPVLMQG